VENQGRAAALNSAAPAANAGWLVSPAFDLLFLANVAWVLALLPWGERGPLEFTQLYFLTTPHRWLTLFLVAADPDRREGRPWVFAGLAALFALLLGAVWCYTGDFVCLLLVDYIWNGWHFASQHAGVAGIYAKRTGATDRPWLERWGLRMFICYVIARTAGWTTGWLEPYPLALTVLAWCDVLILVLPLWIVGGELFARPWRVPKLAYLGSVCLLYSALLLALATYSRSLILSLTLAGALFHATEYIALVTHYAWRRTSTGSAGLFRAMASRWLVLLLSFMLVVGLIDAYLQGGGPIPAWWIGLNLWAAFLHYSYDGLIWRLRRPQTAQALGAGT
jgi:hypothetical protein